MESSLITTETVDVKARDIPCEVWLHKNPKAKASVLRGLKQASRGKKAKSPPDLEADARLAQQLDD